jgi:hypothetical protein
VASAGAPPPPRPRRTARQPARPSGTRAGCGWPPHWRGAHPRDGPCGHRSLAGRAAPEPRYSRRPASVLIPGWYPGTASTGHCRRLTIQMGTGHRNTVRPGEKGEMPGAAGSHSRGRRGPARQEPADLAVLRTGAIARGLRPRGTCCSTLARPGQRSTAGSTTGGWSSSSPPTAATSSGKPGRGLVAGKDRGERDPASVRTALASLGPLTSWR